MKLYLLAALVGLLVGLGIARDTIVRSFRNGIVKPKRMPCVCVRNGASSCDGACRMFYGKAGW